MARASYTQEEYRLAREVNILDYLQYCGYELERSGKDMQMKEHNSLKISEDGKWYWYSRNTGGRSPIELLKLLNGDNDTIRAIRELAAYAGGGRGMENDYAARTSKSSQRAKETPEFQLPEANGDNKRAYAYLIKARGLDAEIVSQCMRDGLIYESKKYHNAVFVGQKDETGRIRYASLRGTYTNAEKPFKGDVSGSEKQYGFAVEGNSDRLIVAESAIDVLSQATLTKLDGGDWKKDHRLALSGISDNALELYLKRHPEIRQITFCLDNDLEGKDSLGNPHNHGQIRAETLIEEYSEKGYLCDNYVPAMGKDVNEELQRRRTAQQIQYQPQEQTQGLDQPLFPGSKLLSREEVLERLKDGVRDVFTSENYKEYLKVMSKFHEYSARNSLLIKMQRPDATRVAGYNAWKNKFSRQVNQGEHGIRILAPIFRRVSEKVEERDRATGEKKIVIKEKEEIVSFRPVSVFDVSQTQGKELPRLVKPLEGSVHGFSDFMEAVTNVSNVPIQFAPIQNSEAKGFYSRETNSITIKEGMSEAQSMKTAVHELVHSRLHSEGMIDRQEAEVEAESVAFVVCEHFGLDTSEYSFPYIAGWAGRDSKALTDFLEVIQKESTKLIGELNRELERVRARDMEQTQKREYDPSTATRIFIEPKEAETALNKGISLQDPSGNRIVNAEEYRKLPKAEKQNCTIAIEDMERQETPDPFEKTRNRFIKDLFRCGFEKNPMEALQVFGIRAERSELNQIVCRKDSSIQKTMESEVSLEQTVQLIQAQLKQANDIPGDMKVEINWTDAEFPVGQYYSLHAASRIFPAYEQETQQEGKQKQTQISLYTKTDTGSWRWDGATFTFGSGDAKDLVGFMEKTLPPEIAEKAKKTLDMQQKTLDNSKTEQRTKSREERTW